MEIQSNNPKRFPGSFGNLSSATSAEDVRKNPSMLSNGNAESSKNLIINKELEKFNSGGDIRNGSRSSKKLTEPVEFFNSREELDMANARDVLNKNSRIPFDKTNPQNVPGYNPEIGLIEPVDFYNNHEELAMANTLDALRLGIPSSDDPEEKNVPGSNPNAELTEPVIFYNSREELEEAKARDYFNSGLIPPPNIFDPQSVLKLREELNAHSDLVKVDLTNILRSSNAEKINSKKFDTEKNIEPTNFQLTETFLRRQICKNVYDCIYAYLNHYYKRLSDKDLESLAYDTLRNYALQCKNRAYVSAVAKNVWRETRIKVDGETLPDNFVAFRNGILDLNTGTMMDFTPSILTLYHVRANYIPGTWSPAFENFLISAGNMKPFFDLLVKQIIGYLLTSDNKGKIIIVLQGKSNSGKSVLTTVLQDLLNPDAYLVMDSNKISDTFSFEGLPGKVLCICPDMTSAPISENVASKLKQLSGGDRITVNRKFKSLLTFKNTAKVLMVTNHRITTKTSDNALIKRIVTVPFGVSVPREEMDINLCEKLLRERDGLVSSCVDAYLALRFDARKRQKMGLDGNYNFANVFKLNEVIESNAPDNDSIESMVQEFVSSCFEPSPDDRVNTSDAYEIFAEKYDVNCPDQFNKLFTRFIKELFGDQVVSSRGPKNGASNGRRGFKGIRLKDDPQF